MKGYDVFGVLPTGYDKSVLHCLLKPKVGNEDDFLVVIVVSPLISLMKDHVINIQQFGVNAALSETTIAKVSFTLVSNFKHKKLIRYMNECYNV